VKNLTGGPDDAQRIPVFTPTGAGEPISEEEAEKSRDRDLPT
jgi:hypothetical protein